MENETKSVIKDWENILKINVVFLAITNKYEVMRHK